MHPIEQWLQAYVNDPRFSAKVESLIEGLDDKDQLRVRLSLLDYLVPKVKTIDPVADTQDKTITINYTKTGKDDGQA
jgi:hypothetical protein